MPYINDLYTNIAQHSDLIKSHSTDGTPLTEVLESIAMELTKLGGSIFAGYHTEMDKSILTQDLPVEVMSRAGMEHISLTGAERVVRELMEL